MENVRRVCVYEGDTKLVEVHISELDEDEIYVWVSNGFECLINTSLLDRE